MQNRCCTCLRTLQGNHWIISLVFIMLECITKSEIFIGMKLLQTVRGQILGITSEGVVNWVIQAGPVNFDAPICFQHQNKCHACVRALSGNWIISLLYIMCWCWVGPKTRSTSANITKSEIFIFMYSLHSKEKFPVELLILIIRGILLDFVPRQWNYFKCLGNSFWKVHAF